MWRENWPSTSQKQNSLPIEQFLQAPHSERSMHRHSTTIGKVSVKWWWWWRFLFTLFVEFVNSFAITYFIKQENERPITWKSIPKLFAFNIEVQTKAKSTVKVNKRNQRQWELIGKLCFWWFLFSRTGSIWIILALIWSEVVETDAIDFTIFIYLLSELVRCLLCQFIQMFDGLDWFLEEELSQKIWNLNILCSDFRWGKVTRLSSHSSLNLVWTSTSSAKTEA